MKPISTLNYLQRPTTIKRLIRLIHAPLHLLALSALLVLNACGGAQSEISSDGTGSPLPPDEVTLAFGPVGGMDRALTGSAGVFEIAGLNATDTTISVSIDGDTMRAARDVRLGMAGTMKSKRAGRDAIATGVFLTVDSLLQGPITTISAIDRANTSQNVKLTALGRDITIDRNTLLSGYRSLSDIAVNDVVKVYGLFTNNDLFILATRVERVTGAAADRIEIFSPVTSVADGAIGILGFNVLTSRASVTNLVNGVSTSTGITTTPPVKVGSVVRVGGDLGALVPSTTAGVASLQATQLTLVSNTSNDVTSIAYDGFVRNFGVVTGQPTASGALGFGAFQLNRSSLILPSPLPPSAAAVSVERVQALGTVVTNTSTNTTTTTITNVQATPVQAKSYRLTGAVELLESAVITLRGERIDVSRATIVGGALTDIRQARQLRVFAEVDPLANDRSVLVATRVELL
jgi:hypothetical protein